MCYEHNGVWDNITGSNQLYSVAIRVHQPKRNEASSKEYK
jgi:hypothetical protein